MKTHKKIQIYSLIAICIVFFFVNSCKKDEPIDPIITWTNPSDITVGTPLSATQLNASCNVPGTFMYTPAIGTVLNIGANQTLQVDFTPKDAKHYNTLTKTVRINVIAKKDPIITWVNPVEITVGTLLSSIQLNATADVAGTFVYTPPIGTSLSVGVNQDLKVDFTPTDVTNYNTASKTVKINVAPSTVTDYDGNVYNTVIIGTQVWMKENLKTTHYANGTPIPLVTGDSNWQALTSTSNAYCWYNDDVANKDTYGALYTWAAAMNGAESTTNNPSGIQGVCPTGWHLPSDAEWTQLTNYLGGESVAGGKLKETGTTHWNSPNTGATNETGFTALPGGSRSSNGTFGNIGNSGYWWSTTEYNATYSWHLSISYNSSNVFIYSYKKVLGFSVRCVRD
jgi:uncharacterized protein (TIGR02145 family)